jgi:hypothetical protein
VVAGAAAVVTAATVGAVLVVELLLQPAARMDAAIEEIARILRLVMDELFRGSVRRVGGDCLRGRIRFER